MSCVSGSGGSGGGASDDSDDSLVDLHEHPQWWSLQDDGGGQGGQGGQGAHVSGGGGEGVWQGLWMERRRPQWRQRHLVVWQCIEWME